MRDLIKQGSAKAAAEYFVAQVGKEFEVDRSITDAVQHEIDQFNNRDEALDYLDEHAVDTNMTDIPDVVEEIIEEEVEVPDLCVGSCDSDSGTPDVDIDDNSGWTPPNLPSDDEINNGFAPPTLKTDDQLLGLFN